MTHELQEELARIHWMHLWNGLGRTLLNRIRPIGFADSRDT